MTRLLLVDDAAALSDLFAEAITAKQGHQVTTVNTLKDVPPALEAGSYSLALVDLSFPGQMGSGIDALAQIHHANPDTTLAIITQGDEWVAQLLRDAWDLLPIASVISKSAPLVYQLEAIRLLVLNGSAPIDPAIQPLIPSQRNPWRSPERFSYLVQHAGHAKLWAALIDSPDAVSYRSIADATGLKLNTIKNYRAQLLGELQLHGIDDTSLEQMRDFAHRCRSFLVPYIEIALRRSES
jgi:DNA-binding NarL/FixJ family response regulator